MFAPDRSKRFCGNTQYQSEDHRRTLDPEVAGDPDRKTALRKDLRKTRLGRLLEFSRAVHAQMDALLSAARKGVPLAGCRLFVTTYPCHYCARHIVTAGIDEVQYIEPYPKSEALKLHPDSIAVEASGWTAPSDGGHQVLFRPFSGVAPRLHRRAFLKDRELKNRETGHMEIHEPEGLTP